ncbi:hypothetical protein GIB67_027190 [Kingdonia uniflora]|uniref:Uncharacterized protein n=1 Tax=Kingdonia uniflora TaxID=39325 RepID=A0A7J7LBI2_9MAGN|nr:hypothetical protein GIB67_027190 [Kingdonia uniflora]
MLGLGDMAIPGMLLALVLSFDHRKSRDLTSHLDVLPMRGKKYIWFAVWGYAIGLVAALAAGILTHSPQPALLYLVPSTLGLVVVLSWFRADLKELWEGSSESINDKAIVLQRSKVLPVVGFLTFLDAHKELKMLPILGYSLLFLNVNTISWLLDARNCTWSDYSWTGTEQVRRILPKDFNVLCTHPMFGPESGRNGWNGLPFVYDKVRIGRDESRVNQCERFLNIFVQEGCRMEETSCKEHDKSAAESQFITHTVGRLGILDMAFEALKKELFEHENKDFGVTKEKPMLPLLLENGKSPPPILELLLLFQSTLVLPAVRSLFLSCCCSNQTCCCLLLATKLLLAAVRSLLLATEILLAVTTELLLAVTKELHSLCCL